MTTSGLLFKDSTARISFNREEFNIAMDRFYIDFVPICTQSSKIFSSPKFEDFRELVKKANQWLTENDHYAVDQCETFGVTRDSKVDIGTAVNSQSTKFNVNEISHSGYVKYDLDIVYCLRLYVRFKTNNEPMDSNHISYINAIPEMITSGCCTEPKFESFNKTMQNFNESLKDSFFPGKILNMENISIPRDGHHYNEDRTGFQEDNSSTEHKLSILRVYFLQQGQSSRESIGCKDFIPSITKVGGCCSSNDYETDEVVLVKVRNWVKSQTGIRITNIQTINVDDRGALKTGASQKCEYIKSKYALTPHFRIIRVFYASEPGSCTYKPINLTWRNFTPAITVNKPTNSDEYETFDLLYKREILPFINYNSNAKVINFEIIPIFPPTKYVTLISSVRIYFHGTIQEPPAIVLGNVQHPKEVETSKNCNIL
ncbi:DgyrCDS9050 [Dimorphilus gyrociliatus]|uniref:DgyrCDS9050 n=1 Tax=Dimorphilus gyrociliatus TaxID=2664684 RepID=A0A7I8VW86_9ANNE|nr:DgyrCDS9050 [Dimorphilus gyrociliatus]